MKTQSTSKSLSSQIEELKELIQSTKKTEEQFFGLEQAAAYTGFKKSYVYKLVHLKQIPVFKPSGRKLFFAKSELDNWIRNSVQRNEVNSLAV